MITKIAFPLPFIFTYVATMAVLFISSCGLKLLSRDLSSQPEALFSVFLAGQLC